VGVVAPIENDGQLFQRQAQRQEALAQELEGLGKAGDIVLVARIDHAEQRQLALPADQEAQAHLAQIGAVLLGMASARQFRPIVGGIDVGEEIGCVEKEGVQGHAQGGQGGPNQFRFYPGQGFLREGVHLVPKDLAGEGIKVCFRKELGQGGAAGPFPEGVFGAGMTSPVEGSEYERLAHGKPGPGLAGGPLVDEIGQAQAVGGGFEGGDGAMFKGLDAQGA